MKTLPPDLVRALPKSEFGKEKVILSDEGAIGEISARFVAMLAPLEEAGKLGLILFQFPPWFGYSKSNSEHLVRCARLVAPYGIAVEFRNSTWLSPRNFDSTLSLLRDRRMTYVTADEPQTGANGAIPFLPGVTSDIAYVRFHGRNAVNWSKKGIPVADRYDYTYGDDELDSFADVVRSLGVQTKATFALFNNCHGAKAIRNAMELKSKIEGS